MLVHDQIDLISRSVLGLEEERVPEGLHAALVQDHDVVCEEICFFEVVGCEDDDAIELDLVDCVPELPPGQWVQTRRWFCINQTKPNQ